jgi:hypothetical protein
VANNTTRLEPWLLCLIQHNGDKNQCLDLAASLVVNEATVMAVLMLLSVSIFKVGIPCGRQTNSTSAQRGLASTFTRTLLNVYRMV